MGDAFGDVTHKAVVLARGLGTRMRRPDRGATLGAGQEGAAETGVKAMMPVGDSLGGRPFIDFILSGLADAGFTSVCLVIGPEHSAVREYFTGDRRPARVAIEFAVQERPLGTADAVLAAEGFVAAGFATDGLAAAGFTAAGVTADDRFLVINSDNYYPVDTLTAMRAAGEPALAAFGRAALLADGQIAAERLAAYALIDTDADGYLRRIVEKPDAETLARFGNAARVSMNCWLFDRAVFDACRAVRPSPRGELELPLAVQQGLDSGMLRIRALPFDAPVLDLSTRADVAQVTSRLTHLAPRP